MKQLNIPFSEVFVFVHRFKIKFWDVYDYQRRPSWLTPTEWKDMKDVGDRAAEEGGDFLWLCLHELERAFTKEGYKARVRSKRSYLQNNWSGNLELSIRPQEKASVYLRLSEESHSLWLGFYWHKAAARQKYLMKWKLHGADHASKFRECKRWNNTIFFPPMPLKDLSIMSPYYQYLRDQVAVVCEERDSNMKMAA